MKSLAAVAVLALSFAAAAEDNKKEVKAVYEAVDGKAVTVPPGATVRLRVQGIAGTTVTHKLTGGGKVSETRVIPLAGKQPLVGAHIVEYEVQTEKAGKVTLEVTAKAPNEDKEKKTTLEITVEPVKEKGK